MTTRRNFLKGSAVFSALAALGIVPDIPADSIAVLEEPLDRPPAPELDQIVDPVNYTNYRGPVTNLPPAVAVFPNREPIELTAIQVWQTADEYEAGSTLYASPIYSMGRPSIEFSLQMVTMGELWLWLSENLIHIPFELWLGRIGQAIRATGCHATDMQFTPMKKRIGGALTANGIIGSLSTVFIDT